MLLLMQAQQERQQQEQGQLGATSRLNSSGSSGGRPHGMLPAMLGGSVQSTCCNGWLQAAPAATGQSCARH
jgi:hypothetical protein